MSRWVRVQTSIFDHALFAQEPFSEREAWLWMITTAAWKNTVHRVGSDVVEVPAGSFFATIREMQSRWRWKSTTRVQSFLKLLIEQDMISVTAKTGKTHVTICNYEKYQNAEYTENTSKRQPEDTEKTLKTPVHQDTNTTSLRSETKRACRLPADFEPDWDFAANSGFTRSQAEAEFAKFSDFWNAKAGKDAAKLDWPATWRNWIRNATPPRGLRPSQQGPPPMTAQQLRQQEARNAFDRKIGTRHDDDFTGQTLDLGAGDFRSQRAASSGR